MTWDYFCLSFLSVSLCSSRQGVGEFFLATGLRIREYAHTKRSFYEVLIRPTGICCLAVRSKTKPENFRITRRWQEGSAESFLFCFLAAWSQAVPIWHFISEGYLMVKTICVFEDWRKKKQLTGIISTRFFRYGNNLCKLISLIYLLLWPVTSITRKSCLQQKIIICF